MDVSLTTNSAISQSLSVEEFGVLLGGDDNGRGGGGGVQVMLLLAVVFPLDPPPPLPLFNLCRRPAFGVRTLGSLAKVIIS